MSESNMSESNMSESNISMLKKYYRMNNELNFILEERYSTSTKYVQFIYYGNMNKNVSRQSEDSRYVLVDTNNQTWEFAKSIKDVKQFLELSENRFMGLIQDISNLIKEEEELKAQLKQNGIRPDIDYSRKLSIALL